MRTTCPRGRPAAPLGRDQMYVAGVVCGRQRAGPMRPHAGWACRGFAARARANRRPSADLVSIPFVVQVLRQIVGSSMPPAASVARRN
jgi:hypothetical protein